MKVSLLTLGCKVNQAEMSDIEGQLRARGHEIVSLSDSPDFCVVNTCTVTSKSDYQSRQLIRRAGRAGVRLIVTGCYSELNKDKVGEMEGVHEVVDNVNKSNIIYLIDRATSSNMSSSASGRARGRTRYFLKVQDGCNNSCSYCIVHIARGPSRSVSPHNIIENIKEAIDQGYREVVLTGIHLGQYGTDLGGEASVSNLVSDILSKTAVERLRLSSLEVNEITKRIISLFDNPRLMPHLHIPLQSGDDEVLKLMKRAYDTEFFKDTVKSICDRIPEIALGTDIIAGFPAETEEAFENTLNLVKELPFTYMHVFPYSRRPSTLAADMEDIVSSKERKRRAQVLRNLSKTKKSLYMNRQKGKILDVLLEEGVGEGICLGTSRNYLKVEVPCDDQILGSIVPVRIMEVMADRLSGEIVNSREVPDLVIKTMCTKDVQYIKP